jgi:membrane fusion protein, multidrug efflux system
MKISANLSDQTTPRPWKKRLLWLLAGLTLLGLGAAAYVYKTKQAEQLAAANAAAAVMAKPKLELLATDVSSLAPVVLGQVLQATGAIKALSQAQVKAQVSAVVAAVTVMEGQAVRAGQVLATTDVQDYQTRLSSAQAAWQQANSQVIMAQRTVDNNKGLVSKGFISETAADMAAQQLDANKAAVKVAQANIDLAQKALKDTAIVSPIAGVITEKLISAGDKVSPDMRVFTIIKPGAVEFEGNLPAAEAALLKVGQTITIETDGQPAITATITRLNAAVNTATRSVTFYAALNNGDAKAASAYRPGSYATGKVLVNNASALAVPAGALREEGGRAVVYTVSAANELVASPVTVGLRGEDSAGNAYAVVDGLAAGSRYISRNLGPLRVGSAVLVGK